MMNTDVVVQVISTLGLVAVAIIGNHKLNRIGADAKEARNQTANTHETNLRDDLDQVKDAMSALSHVKDAVSSLSDDVQQVHSDVRGIRVDINGLRSDDGEIRRQLRQERERWQAALLDHIQTGDGSCSPQKERYDS